MPRAKKLTRQQVVQMGKNVARTGREISNEALASIDELKAEIDEAREEIEVADRVTHIGNLLQRGATFKAAYFYFRADDDVQAEVENASPAVVQMFHERYPQLTDDQGAR